MPLADRRYRYPHALFADVKRDMANEFGQRSSSYIPYPFHHGPGTAYPFSFPLH